MLSELEVLIGDRQLFVNFKLSDLILSIRVEKTHVIIRRCTKLGAVALWGLIHLLSRIWFLWCGTSYVALLLFNPLGSLLLFIRRVLGSNTIECDESDLVEDIEVVYMVLVKNQF